MRYYCIRHHSFSLFGKRRDRSERFCITSKVLQVCYDMRELQDFPGGGGGRRLSLKRKHLRWPMTPQVICSLFDLKDRLTKETNSWTTFHWSLNRFHSIHITSRVPSFLLLANMCRKMPRAEISHWEWGETSASERRGARAPHWAETGELLSARIDYSNQMDFLKWFI